MFIMARFKESNILQGQFIAVNLIDNRNNIKPSDGKSV